MLYRQSAYMEDVLDSLLNARSDLAEHEYLVGNYYFDQKAYNSAIARYRHLLRYYPEYLAKEIVVQKLIEAYQLNQQSELAQEMKAVLQFQQSRLEQENL